jgi:hypothetical protein
VDATFAARLPLEVLHDVRHVSVAAVDPGFLQRTVEQPSGRPDERPAGDVLLVARLFAHQHEAGFLHSFAEHSLRAAAPQRTRLAVRRHCA